jgi:hypothetical protein
MERMAKKTDPTGRLDASGVGYVTFALVGLNRLSVRAAPLPKQVVRDLALVKYARWCSQVPRRLPAISVSRSARRLGRRTGAHGRAMGRANAPRQSAQWHTRETNHRTSGAAYRGRRGDARNLFRRAMRGRRTATGLADVHPTYAATIRTAIAWTAARPASAASRNCSDGLMP